ncbi:MAG: STAS domain-containing protein [Planctomycetota bacterium]|nr:STAS domain-containing protein [Planctomycetota bacterium]
MPGIKIKTQKTADGVAYIKVVGFLDAHTFVQMEEEIVKLFNARIYKVAVDLSGLEYISSAGAGVFISNVGEATANGGNIVFINPSEPVREVFDLLGLTQIFQIFETKEEAFMLFRKGR